MPVTQTFLYCVKHRASDSSCSLFNDPVMSDSATPWTVAHQAFPSLTISRSLPKFMAIESVMPSNTHIYKLYIT